MLTASKFLLNRKDEVDMLTCECESFSGPMSICYFCDPERLKQQRFFLQILSAYGFTDLVCQLSILVPRQPCRFWFIGTSLILAIHRPYCSIQRTYEGDKIEPQARSGTECKTITDSSLCPLSLVLWLALFIYLHWLRDFQMVLSWR